MTAPRAIPAFRLARLDLRTDVSGTLSLALLVVVATGLAAGAPIWFARSADAALPAIVRSASPVARDLAFSLDGYLSSSPEDPLAAVDEVGSRLQDALPASLKGMVTRRVESVDTEDLPAFELASRELTVGLRLRVQDGVDEWIRYVRGRPPAGGAVAGYEVAISGALAAQLVRDVGDRVALAAPYGAPLAVEIVGIFEPLDPAADYWADPALISPTVRVMMESKEVHGTALLATADFPAVFGEMRFLAFRYRWRFLLDWDRLDADGRGRVASDLASLRIRYPFRGATVGSDVPSVSTGLRAILERYEAERSAAQTAMILAVVGPAFAAVGAIAMVAATIARRREGAVLLVRARGATSVDLLGARTIMALAIVLPAVGLTAGAAIALAGTEWTATILAIALLVAALAIGLLLAAALRQVRESAARLRQARPPRWWGSPPSIVRDVLLVVIAAAGVGWIGQRSAAGAAGTAAGDGLDPLLVAVPVLIALAGAVITWRCYRPLVVLLARVAAAHPGFVPVHAMRGPARGSGGLQVPLVVLVITIAIGVFTTVIALSLQREQVTVAWQQVGAEYRVESATRYSLPLDVSAVPGVEVAAGAVLRDGVLAGGSVRALPVVVEAIDVDPYLRVVGGTPADPFLPGSFGPASWDGASGTSPEQPIPALLIGDAARRPALGLGGDFRLSGLGKASYFRVAGIRPAFPGATSPEGTVVVPLGALVAATPQGPFRPSVFFVRAPESLLPALRSATVLAYAPTVVMVARSEVRAAQEADPLVRNAVIGFALALLVSVAFAGLVVAVAVFRDLAGREAEIALLRAVGTKPRQILGLIVLEQGSVVLTAIGAGVVLGSVMAVIAVPSLGLDRFVRPGDVVSASIEWPTIAAVALVQGGVALLVMLLATALGQRRAPAAAMMSGDA